VKVGLFFLLRNRVLPGEAFGEERGRHAACAGAKAGTNKRGHRRGAAASEKYRNEHFVEHEANILQRVAGLALGLQTRDKLQQAKGSRAPLHADLLLQQRQLPVHAVKFARKRGSVGRHLKCLVAIFFKLPLRPLARSSCLGSRDVK